MRACIITVKIISIKFLVNFGKSATEILKLLQEMFGDKYLSQTRVFESVKRFKDGRKDVTDTRP